MKVIQNELTVLFDVDDTLVMHGRPVGQGTEEFVCPYTGKIEHLVPHDTHIQILKQQKGRGFHVTVWSAGGWEWAKTVVDKLGLNDYVDEVRSKPVKVFDDAPATTILTVVYIPHKEKVTNGQS